MHTIKKLLNHFQVARQHEPQLIRAINKLCDGQLDDGVEEFVEGLSRPLDDDSDACRLFGTKFDAVYVNQMFLDKLKIKTTQGAKTKRCWRLGIRFKGVTICIQNDHSFAI